MVRFSFFKKRDILLICYGGFLLKVMEGGSRRDKARRVSGM